MAGFLADLFILGVIKLFDKASGKPKPDRVELPPHVWQGNTLKPHYNRRFLGPIKNETFLRTSKLMLKASDNYSLIVSSLSETKQLSANSPEILSLHPIQEKIQRYMRQIDRRTSLRCYQAWKENHPDSYDAYHSARNRIISLDNELEEICRKNDIPFNS